MEIGVLGLGRMGIGIARRLLARQHRVVGFDLDRDARQRALDAGARIETSARAAAERLTPPRTVWLMLPAGRAVDTTIAELEDCLSAGDLIVDGGNSFYRDSIRRAAALAEREIQFVDVGTSGGVHGETLGFCLMAGGDESAVERVRPVLEALAPAADRGWSRVGPSGAGHFTKMVHNGIEYGLMQAYAEGFSILEAREDLGLDPGEIADLWRHGSVVRSWLLDLIRERLAKPEALSTIAPYVTDSGGGRWTVKEAIDLDIPTPVIAASLQQRLRSRSSGGFADRLVAALREQFGGHDTRPADGDG